MEALPEDVALALLRGLGAYLRAAPSQDLPANVRRFKGFRATALAKHRDQILKMLDDENDRAMIVQWLDDEKPALSKEDAAILRIAAERSDGWQKALLEKSSAKEPPAASAGDGDNKLRVALEREKEKVRKTKDELRLARTDHESVLRAERKRADSAEADAKQIAAEASGLKAEVDKARAELKAERERSDRETRRARADVDKAEVRADEATAEAKQLRRELVGARKQIAALESAAKPKRSVPKSTSEPSAARARLKAPKGRLQDDPETLEEWLSGAGVLLVIDGYNVTKAEGGFGDLELPKQRDRLIQEATKLARRTKVTGHIVFDGNEVPPGTNRPPRGPLKVAYSRSDEIADDHIVALIETLPKVPVVLVTNDKELQHRGAALGATIATSNQFLKLLTR